MKPLFILLFLALATYAQQTSVAVLPSDGTAINNDELEALTDEMRVAALKVLPTNAFTLLKQDVVIKRLGGMESYIKKCTESSCIVDLGKQAQVDYVSQAIVSRLGNSIRLKVELYNVRTEGLVDMLSEEADNVKGLLSIVKKKAPEIFSKIKNYSVSITSEPEGADLSFDVVYSKCTTPCKIELPASSVRITADLEEYETADTTISIKQNNQRILIKLNPNFGFLDVKPAYSDGIGKDEQWSLTLNGQSFYSLENKLPADKYKGELSHRCYEDISFNISIGKGKRQVFDMAKQVKPKKGGLVLKSEKNGEPVFVNGKQIGKTPFSGSVPLCAVVEVGKSKERVDVELEHNGKVEYTHESEYEVLKKRGNAYFDEGNYDQAIEEYTAALRIKPYDPEALNWRGAAYYNKGNYDRAIEDHTDALRIKPNYQNAIYNRGNAYYKKGNYDLAIEDYEAVLKIDPNDVNAKNNLEKIRQSKSEAKSNIRFFTDNRDGKKYKAVTIGRQTWMAENLNYNVSGSKCYNNNSAYCDKYGRLYDWTMAKVVCPKFWHLPSNAEWQAIVDFAGGNIAGKNLKAKNDWDYGTDIYDFSALPGGYINSGGNFTNAGSTGSWWSSTEYDKSNAFNQYIDSSERVSGNYNIKISLRSVRCLQD